MAIAKVKQWVPADFWNSAFKFASERHPYEKAVSLAFARYHPENSVANFDDHLDQIVREGYRVYRSFRLYTIEGESVMDDFILHHRLDEDLTRIRLRLGLPTLEIPHARSGKRQDHRPARDILSERQRNFVYRKCKRNSSCSAGRANGRRRSFQTHLHTLLIRYSVRRWLRRALPFHSA